MHAEADARTCEACTTCPCATLHTRAIVPVVERREGRNGESACEREMKTERQAATERQEA
eukprot:6212503-Pleurochrysis_carterae.AAC.2